jgi:hypothetical protein
MRILRRILGVSFALSLLVIALALALSGAYAQDKQGNQDKQ